MRQTQAAAGGFTGRGILGLVEAEIAVFGLGYVGCVTGACLANLGHRVIGVDKDEFKVQSIAQGKAPFFEPGLDDLVRANADARRFRATTKAGEALAEASIAIVCVGTPSQKNGNLGLEQLQRVCAEIGKAVEHHQKPLTVAIRSTVFPGTCDEVVRPALANVPGVRIVANPEFLREGNAIQDFLKPSLIVVGSDDYGAAAAVAGLYTSLGVTPSIVSLRTAEMIKYACNSFHALKICFANEIGSLAAEVGVSPDEVMETLCRDTTLNTSAAYLKPGFAFGGSCLPKDLRALVYRASRMDLRVPLLETISASNDAHLERAIRKILELGSCRIGVFGLAFKENTDDLRESPVVHMLEQLIGKGRDLRIFDPYIRLDYIYGSNQRYLLNAIPHIGRLMVADPQELLGWAEHLVIAQKPGDAHAAAIARCGLPATDLYRLTARPAAQ